MTTLAHYQTILDAAGEPYRVLPLQMDGAVLITRRGGRILGLFPAPDAPNLLWTSSAFDSVEAFRAFTTRTDGWHWNLGGDRIWIAPEITYNVRDRRDFGGTWAIPPAMDPGEYALAGDDHSTALTAEVRLTGCEHGAVIGETHVRVTRMIYPVPPPVYADASVVCLGYEQQVTLGRRGSQPQPFSEVWNLVQLNAGGTLIIPVIGAVEASDYVAPVPDFARQVTNGALHLPLNGRQQFKIGYQSPCMTGRMGYLQQLPDGRAALLVRNFFNDPANLYAEEPPDQPGKTGHSVHVYNDGGAVDQGRPFCEMECSGRTLGTFNGFTRSAAHDTFSLWAYVGAPDAIREIARNLLGSAV